MIENQPNNYYSIFILWDSLENYFDIITRKIEKEFSIEINKIVYLNSLYYNFIIDIYDLNNQRDLGKYKANMMYKPDKKQAIKILIVKIISDNLNNDLIYDRSKIIKKNIRNEYKGLVDNYFHDNLIHCTDNLVEYNNTKKILKKYKITE